MKVQYPGIDKAIESDLSSLSMLESMIAPVGRRYHTKEGLEEIKSVFRAELDYTHEAETADVFRRVHAEDPEIVIRFYPRSNTQQLFFRTQAALDATATKLGLNKSFPTPRASK